MRRIVLYLLLVEGAFQLPTFSHVPRLVYNQTRAAFQKLGMEERINIASDQAP